MAVNYMYRMHSGITDLEIYIDRNTKRTTQVTTRITNAAVTPMVGTDNAAVIRYAAIH